MKIREHILQRVTGHYLATEEFNGLSASQLIAEVGEADSTAAIEQLVNERPGGKKPKSARGSVYGIPGGAFESNRRKF